MIEHYELTAQRTLTVMQMDFTSMSAQIRDDGLAQNPCYPKDLDGDPNFACKPIRMYIFVRIITSNALQCSGLTHGTNARATLTKDPQERDTRRHRCPGSQMASHRLA